jgi:Spx/MgsR family transcriptional regulator
MLAFCPAFDLIMALPPILVYGIPNCDTVKKARAWLTDNSISFEFIDLKKNPISSIDIQFWLDQIQANVLINQKGTTWKSLSESEKNLTKTNSGVIDIALQHPSTIKRPVAIWPDNKVTVGFSPDSWQSIAQEYQLVQS